MKKLYRSLLTGLLCPLLSGPLNHPLSRADARAQEALAPEQIHLIQACLQGDLKAAQAALQAGADLEATSGVAQATPLQLALYRDHLELVAFLLEQGADPRVKNRNGKSPLIIAANGGQFDLTRLLLKYPVGLESQDDLGQTALLAALSGGHLKVADLLLRAGARADSLDKNGNTALHLLVHSLSTQSAQRFWAPQPRPDGRQLGAAHYARYQWYSRLYAAGVPLNGQNAKGQTALMLLAQAGRRSDLEHLQGLGANAQICDFQGISTRQYAQQQGFRALAEQLPQIKCPKKESGTSKM